MSELSEKQRKFVRMVADLIIYAYDTLGVELTWGDAYRDPRAPYGARGSLHGDRLAVDFNLFVDGDYIGGYHDMWKRLGEYWKSLGGTWGGDFENGQSAGDFNHFSLSHRGMR